MIIVIILDDDMLFIPVLFIFTLIKTERMKVNLFISHSVWFFCFFVKFYILFDLSNW